MKWLPEIGALGAAIVIAGSMGMRFMEAVVLWVCLDLMTATRKQIKKITGGAE